MIAAARRALPQCSARRRCSGAVNGYIRATHKFAWLGVATRGERFTESAAATWAQFERKGVRAAIDDAAPGGWRVQLQDIFEEMLFNESADRMNLAVWCTAAHGRHIDGEWRVARRPRAAPRRAARAWRLSVHAGR